ncbi:MAG: hypothetical protein HN533_01970, partial [Euryarchaeota archaeon]|nr:hypothetical protein [Euryarchaeota archaeon]
LDAFPFDSTESNDVDGDGIGDNADTDNDNDGTLDSDDAFPLDDCADTDTDGDGSPDTVCTANNFNAVGSDIASFGLDENGALTLTFSSPIETDGIGSDVVVIMEMWDDSTNSWENLDGTGLDNGGTHTTFTCNMEYWCDEYTGVELVRATLTNSGIDSIAYYDGSSGIGYLGESADDDDDNDGYSDEDETDNCGTASDPLDNTSMPLDTDMDMACDELDDDDDGDTVNDSDESIGCMLVTDCDGDGVGDADEGIVTGDDSDIASFGLSENGALTMIFSSPIETDGIGSDVVYYMDTWNEATNSWDNMIGVGLDNGDTHTIHSCNMEYWCEEYTGVELVRARLTSYGIDSIAYYNGSSGIGYLDDMHVDVDCTITVDCDGDTFDDLVDAFPLDASEWSDMDGDGFGDNDDDGDIDGDGLANAYDACPLDANEYYDTDGDGICDNADDDDDGDGVLDVDDVSPLDSDESSDWDGDGIGDNTDADDDGDGIDDDVDLDEDGESQAYDFDNDGWDDDDEVTCETNGTNSESIPSDNDDDGLCDDFQDDDDDNDGTVDAEDAFPLDTDVYADNDGDGMADSSDVDTNNDYIITTESYSTLTVGVYDYDGNELCMLETDGAYNGAAGDQDSCEINAAGIEIVAIDVDYYTYFGAFYAGYGYSGYGSAVNINVTIGEDEYTYAADYGWVSATSGDSTMSTDEFYATTSAGTVMDEDDDNDGYSDLAETDNCGTASDSMDDASMPLDTDMDMICDELDDDDDDDGYSDADETTNCGTASDSLDNESTPLDTDMDMLCDELDEDDDNDGYSDADETTNCPSDPSDPLNSVDTTRDFDQDGLCDDLDSDDDGDGVDDVDDAFPYDWDATMDTDGDGLADDIDNMATGDWLFEIAYDADGGNNTFIITVSSFNWSLEPNPSDFDANIVDLCMTDTSDSNDSYADCMVDGDTDLVQVELQVIGEPEAYLSTTFPNGFVFESPLGDVIDDEGFATWWFSPITWWGTALDWDDDNDWFWDVEEEMYCVDDEHGATDSLDDTDMPLDTDMDMLCNGIDVDDDNDGYYDADDAFPVHASSYMDTDGDGMPDFMELVVGDMGDDFELGNFSGMDWNQRDAHPNWGWNDSYGEIFNCEDGQVISWFGQSFVPSYWINDGYVDCNDGSDESVDMDTFGPELTGWERSGDVNFGIGTGSFVDSYGVRGMGLDANESASLSITIETSDGFMTFDYAISSEERYDEMCLFVDGMEYGCMSGQEPKSTYLDENGDWLDFICETPGVYGEQISIDWVQDGWDDCGDSDGDGISDDEDASLSIWTYATGTMEIYVSEGIHTFEWQYSKDGDTDGGSDRVYLDNIRFPTMVEGDLDELTIDMDDDNDGVEDEMDGCPLDDTEQIDTDGDGFCNNQDSDDDGDGVYDYNDAMPLDANEQYDFDGDGIGDNTDTDNDNDGCENDVDDLPFDESSCDDFDGDGVGDEADMDDDGDNVLDAEDPFPFDGTAWLDNDGDGMPDFNGPPQFAGDFEGGSISAPWDTYGDADWTVVDSTTSLTGAIINGTFSAQSGDISDSQTSSLAVEFSTIAGDLSFEYVTSTENNWDYLRFYVDGILQASWSGSTSGVHVQSITAGTHTFEFQFYKDGSVSSGDDTVWVDDLVLPLAQIANTNNDTDDDNDGTMDDYDLDPLNPCVALDTDGDGLPDSVESGMFDMSGTGDEDYWVDCDASGYYADSDDDGDDWSDEDEMICGSDSLDNNSTPDDFDNDWLCDLLDNDSDNDGIEDSLDSFPYDSTESEDYDGDGIGDNADSDDDNDNVSDVDDAFPYDANESADLDGDGQGDNADNDTDGDGVPNDVDSFPTDDDASTDTDGDGIDDEADTDDDGDGVPDVVDWAPLDSAESVDSDGDGLGDNADTDDDNDSVEDGIDAFPLDSSEYADYDGDGVGDNADIDDDNDGIPDGVDLFPNDATESRDLDEDGLGDNSDSDRDGDGVANADDIFPDNAAETVDLDMDGIGDNSDVDDDGDGDLDEFDSFPTDSAEWDDTDADGIGNNADDDDDGDGALDIVEDRCGSDSENANSVPSDYDLDGICDAEDSEVSNSDTLEEQDELGWSNAVPGFPAIFAGIALVGAALIGRRNDD